MLGSVGVIVAAVIIYTTGWAYADPLIGAGIGLFILPRTWKLTGQALRILMEVAPPGHGRRRGPRQDPGRCPEWSTCTTCTSGRSPREWRPPPGTSSSTTAPTTTTSWTES